MAEMNTALQPMTAEIVSKIHAAAERLLSGQPHLALIYGSHAYGLAHRDSDIDVVFACTERTDETYAGLHDEVISAHQDLGLELDAEVPYEAKLLVTWDDLRIAATCVQFQVSAGQYSVRPISKNEQFLASREMQLRLLLNILAGKSVCASGSHERLKSLQDAARASLAALMVHIHGLANFSSCDLVRALLGDAGASGEDYLGFKPIVEVVKFLEDVMEDRLVRGVTEGWVAGQAGAWSIPDAGRILSAGRAR